MRVLMFGWEFPPHISGGLGTASYGLTRGLSSIPGMEVIFVVPRAYGDEDQSSLRLIGANDVRVAHKKVIFKGSLRSIEKIEVESRIVPYTDPEHFWRLTRSKSKDQKILVRTNDQENLIFQAGTGITCSRRLKNIRLWLPLLPLKTSFDVIHAHDWLAYPAGIAARQVSGKPLVIHVHATDFDRSGGSVNPVVYDIERRGMEAADRIITVSNLTLRNCNKQVRDKS
ncbi:MAG: glycosyltransferase [Bacteroidales bacterium]